MRDYAMIGQMELQNKNSKKLIEQLEKKDKKIEELTDKLLKVMDKYTELQNIIKEVREYIENNLYSDYGDRCDVSKKEIFQILDKEVK